MTRPSMTVSRGLLILAAAAAVSFGAITSLATADHFHNWNSCNNTG